MPTAAPLISIITPVFNGELFIGRCIESVQQQQADCYEHIILDGGSLDNTASLIRHYVSGDKRIRFVSEPDKGVYDAMNKGIASATGKWVYFLGADDYFYSRHVLSEMAAFIKTSQADIFYGNAWYEKYQKLYDGEFSTEKLLKRNICHQAVFYRAAIFQRLGAYQLRFTKEADYDFNLRAWLSGIKTKYTPVTIAFYSAGGLSNDSRDAQLVAEYPELVTGYLLGGRRSFFTKIHLLSAVFRKTIIRYSWKRMVNLSFSGGRLLHKILALIWLLISLPFYLLISPIFDRK